MINKRNLGIHVVFVRGILACENLAMARRLLTTQGQSAALECEVEKLSREASKYSQAFYTIASDTEKVVGVVAEGDHCNKIEVNRDLETGFEVSMI